MTILALIIFGLGLFVCLGILGHILNYWGKVRAKRNQLNREMKRNVKRLGERKD